MAVSFVLLFVAMLNDYDPAVFLVTPGTEVMGLTMLKLWVAGTAGPVAALGVDPGRDHRRRSSASAGSLVGGAARCLTSRITGLTKTFDAHIALDDVALDARDGELLTLLGPSGCGKSTTLWSIAGLHQPDTGAIEIGDDDRVRRARRACSCRPSGGSAASSSSRTRCGRT